MKGKAYICNKGHIFYTVAAGLTWDINLARSVREIVETGCLCGTKHEMTLDFDGKVEDFTRELGLREFPPVILANRKLRCLDLSSIHTTAMATS